jgi:hypothetical protein
MSIALNKLSCCTSRLSVVIEEERGTGTADLKIFVQFPKYTI